MIAAFLASNNRKESDDHLFGSHKRGKRKKKQKGHDENELETASYTHQTFSLDRLLGIFTTISLNQSTTSIGMERRFHHTSSDYEAKRVEDMGCNGDASIFSSVTYFDLMLCYAYLSGQFPPIYIFYYF